MATFLHYLIFILAITVTVLGYIGGLFAGVWCLIEIADEDVFNPRTIKIAVASVFVGSVSLALAITMGG